MMKEGIHLAVIPDGNRRWAKKHGKSIPEGHQAGINKLKDAVEWCKDLGVNTLSVWIFSTENAGRSKEEVDALFKLFDKMLDRIETDKDYKTIREKVNVRFSGRMDIFPTNIRERAKRVEKDTSGDRDFKLVILCGYGGRQELIDAANHMIKDAKAGKINEIDEDSFGSYLYNPDISNPDLVFRSSGEKRLSGLLPWQTVYSEFYFCEKLWPDITKEDFKTAISEFKSRDRRFGKK